MRLPEEFARQLFEISARGDTSIVISDDRSFAALARAGVPDCQARIVGLPFSPGFSDLAEQDASGQ